MAAIHAASAGQQSTCDLSITMPVHIDKFDEMKEMLHSAVKDSHGFGNL